MVPPVQVTVVSPGLAVNVPAVQPAVCVEVAGLATTIWKPPAIVGSVSVKLTPVTAPPDQLLIVMVNVVGWPGATLVGAAVLVTVSWPLPVDEAVGSGAVEAQAVADRTHGDGVGDLPSDRLHHRYVEPAAARAAGNADAAAASA